MHPFGSWSGFLSSAMTNVSASPPLISRRGGIGFLRHRRDRQQWYFPEIPSYPSKRYT